MFLSKIFTLAFLMILGCNIAFSQSIPFKSDKYGYEITFPSQWKDGRIGGGNGEFAVSKIGNTSYSVYYFKKAYEMQLKIMLKKNKSLKHTTYDTGDYKIIILEGQMKDIYGTSNGIVYYIKKNDEKSFYAISANNYDGTNLDDALVEEFVKSFKANDNFNLSKMMENDIASTETNKSQNELPISVNTEPKKIDIGVNLGVAMASGEYKDLANLATVGYSFGISYGRYFHPKSLTSIEFSISGIGEGDVFYGSTSTEPIIGTSTKITYIGLDKEYLLGTPDVFGIIIGSGIGYYKHNVEFNLNPNNIISLPNADEQSGIGISPKIGAIIYFSDFSVGTEVQWHFCPESLNYMTAGLTFHFGK